MELMRPLIDFVVSSMGKKRKIWQGIQCILECYLNLKLILSILKWGKSMLRWGELICLRLILRSLMMDGVVVVLLWDSRSATDSALEGQCREEHWLPGLPLLPSRMDFWQFHRSRISSCFEIRRGAPHWSLSIFPLARQIVSTVCIII